MLDRGSTAGEGGPNIAFLRAVYGYRLLSREHQCNNGANIGPAIRRIWAGSELVNP